jgi:hypothetical protein
MFTKMYGRKHRITGGILFIWLIVGFLDIVIGHQIPFLLYDIVLGILGTSTTLTAAFEFEVAHKKVKNKASGTLNEDATVTYSEMIEHSFYHSKSLHFHQKKLSLLKTLQCTISCKYSANLVFTFYCGQPRSYFNGACINVYVGNSPMVLSRLLPHQ